MALLNFNPNNLYGILVGVIVWIIAAFLCEGRFGGGDIKLIMEIGVVLGFYPTLYGLIFALLLQIMFFTLTSKNKNQSMPLGPFLAIGFLTTYFINLNI